MFTVKEIFDAIEKELVKKLAAKTNWRRQEIMMTFLQAKADAVAELLEKKGE